MGASGGGDIVMRMLYFVCISTLKGKSGTIVVSFLIGLSLSIIAAGRIP